MQNFDKIFSELRSIMLPYAHKMNCTTDTDDELNVNTHNIQKNKKPLWFGAVQIKKNYVSYHLMPVYINPKLLETISPALKKRMQGKSCFNFTSFDASLFKELAELTEACFKDYEKQGYTEMYLTGRREIFQIVE
ncbi:MAG: hypothetical protein WD097_02905 [Balneolales bacterium]